MEKKVKTQLNPKGYLEELIKRFEKKVEKKKDATQLNFGTELELVNEEIKFVKRGFQNSENNDKIFAQRFLKYGWRCN